MRVQISSSSFFLFLSVCVLLAACAKISEGDLKDRVQTAKPTWQNYLEDLKTQIGAGPTAQWQGAPVQATRDKDAVRITFQLRGPWAGYGCAIPVLIREPRGSTLAHTSYTRENDRVVYLFRLPPIATEIPWLELKFPTGQTRIVFNQTGTWNAG